MNSRSEQVDFPARPMRRGLLPVFLASSVALHAAVVAVVPPAAHEFIAAEARVLEVVLVQTEPPRPLPVAPEPVALPRKPRHVSEPVSEKVAVAPPRRTDVAQPVLALPEPGPSAEPAFTVPREPDKRAAPDTRGDIAKAAPTLPSFSAAYLRNPAPRYPMTARRAGEQGTVTLKVLVTRDGSPARVDVEKSSGSPPLDSAALEAVRAWRFVPARQGPEAIESWVLVPIVFRLEGPS